MSEAAVGREGDLARLARLLLLLLILSLAFMQPSLFILGFPTAPTDFVYPLLVAVWLVALAAGQVRIVPHKAWWRLALYFAAMAASALVAEAPIKAAAKLVTQAYLLSLPVLVVSLVVDRAALRSAMRWWLMGTAAVVAVAAASLMLFMIDPASPLLDLTRYRFGTLPPGAYPRLRLTFLNANMACNYLAVSLSLLLAARRLGWIASVPFAALLAGICAAAATTISPGLGGVALAIGIWFWLIGRESRPGAARLALAGAIAVATLFVAAMAVTPILHPTAPFLIELPGTGATLAPAGRLLTWIDAARNFLAEPLLGRGIGAAAALVRYRDPEGNLQRLTDAHNMFLNIAVQCGIAGLAALVALVVYALRRTAPFRLLPGDANVARLALGFAFLNGFVYQGLGGSFEDARHLWVLFGLLLASGRIEARDPR